MITVVIVITLVQLSEASIIKHKISSLQETPNVNEQEHMNLLEALEEAAKGAIMVVIEHNDGRYSGYKLDEKDGDLRDTDNSSKKKDIKIYKQDTRTNNQDTKISNTDSRFLHLFTKSQPYILREKKRKRPHYFKDLQFEERFNSKHEWQRYQRREAMKKRINDFVTGRYEKIKFDVSDTDISKSTSTEEDDITALLGKKWKEGTPAPVTDYRLKKKKMKKHILK